MTLKPLMYKRRQLFFLIYPTLGRRLSPNGARRGAIRG